MPRPHARLTVLALSFLLAACSGDAASPNPAGSPPRPEPTASATSGPTDPATPSATPGASPTADASAPVATAEPTATGGSLGAWSSRDDVAAGPSAREDHTWTVDGDGAIAYLFGGRTADGASDELWAYDLASDMWSPLDAGDDLPAPPPRWGHTATWVSDVGLVIWSGQSREGFFDDIWAYDPLANAWSQLPASGAAPAARYGSCASLGPDGQLWISHGFTGDGRFDDTRSYDFAAGAWTDRTPAGDVPVERCLHDCYWSAGGELVLYGGQTNGVAALGDLWTYDAATGTWAETGGAAAPARQLYALTPVGDEAALVFGGAALDGTFLNDLWRLDASGLTAVGAPGAAPPARSGAALLSDPARGRLLLFGGTDADGVLGDLWELRATLQ